MKLEIKEHGLEIIPETQQDIAYIRDTLGLKEDNDSIILLRCDANNVIDVRSKCFLMTITDTDAKTRKDS